MALVSSRFYFCVNRFVVNSPYIMLLKLTIASLSFLELSCTIIHLHSTGIFQSKSMLTRLVSYSFCSRLLPGNGQCLLQKWNISRKPHNEEFEEQEPSVAQSILPNTALKLQYLYGRYKPNFDNIYSTTLISVVCQDLIKMTQAYVSNSLKPTIKALQFTITQSSINVSSFHLVFLRVNFTLVA